MENKKVNKKGHKQYLREVARKMREKKRNTNYIVNSTPSTISATEPVWEALRTENNTMELSNSFINLNTVNTNYIVNSTPSTISATEPVWEALRTENNTMESSNSFINLNTVNTNYIVNSTPSTISATEPVWEALRTENNTMESSNSFINLNTVKSDKGLIETNIDNTTTSTGEEELRIKQSDIESSQLNPVNEFTEEHNFNECSDERRIIDLQSFLDQLKKISAHSKAFGCGLQNLELIGEKRCGLVSKLTFKCNMCNVKLYINTSKPNPKDNLDLNTAIVTGAITTGVGYTQLQELFASINIPFLSERLYTKTDDQVSEEWEKVATLKMEIAAAREKQCAFDEGRVNSDGVPVIDVVVDGCWAKRTYKKNYSSLSGAAAIIGKKFGEVLYLGVKNKYCCVCARAENSKSTPKEHKCFKNYSGSSTNMESEILVEGFRQSLNMYGIIYGKMVADGDASTYSKILDARPYANFTVEKIECRNHLLRNLCNKLQALIKDTKYTLQQRKYLSTQRILAIRKVIYLSIKHIKDTNVPRPQQINNLYIAITNSYNHAFGCHTNCQDFYCNSKKKSEDVTAVLKDTAVENKIKFIIGHCAAHSRSLIEDVDSNRCEQFNAIIAKSVGGKRINFCLRRSYQTRCSASVVSFNTKRPLYNIQKSMLGVSPKSKSKLLELQKLKKRCAKSNVRRKKLIFNQKQKRTNDEHYGKNCRKPDLPSEDLERLKQTFLKNLEKSDEERVNIERETILQSDCSKWLEMRRKLITASNFGKILNKRPSTSGSLVKAILYKKDLSGVASIKHGNLNEKNALRQLEKQENIKIMPCGLFIDKHYPFLGASPDGVIDEDHIVEIKCPISAYQTTFEDAVLNKKITFWKHINGEFIINEKHQWFWQVQGQLNITNRKVCLFAVWLGQNHPIKIEKIIRNQKLWDDIMVPKLSNFYHDSLLPELLDPRYSRNMPLREINAAVKDSVSAVKRKNTSIKSDSKIKKTG